MDYSPYQFKNFYDRRNKGGSRGGGTVPYGRRTNNPYGGSYSQNNSSYDPNYYRNNNNENVRDAEFKKEDSSVTSVVNDKNGRYESNQVDHVVEDTRTHYKGAECAKSECSNRAENESGRVKPKRDKTGIFIVAIIILSFVVVILSAEILGGGIILDTLSKTFNPNLDTNYYVVSFDIGESKNEAEAKAEEVKKSLGAGYVINQNGHYFVAIATYLDKKSAESVAKKNSGTTILELSLYKTEFSDKESELNKQMTDKTIEKCKGFIDKLYVLGLDTANNGYDVAEATEKVKKIRNEMLEFKDMLTNSGLTKGEIDKKMALFDPAFLTLNNIVLNGSDNYLPTHIRYATVSIVCSLVDFNIDS